MESKSSISKTGNSEIDLPGAHRNVIAVIRDAFVDHRHNSGLFLGREFEAEFGPGLTVPVYDQNPRVEGIGEINAYFTR